MKQSSEKRGAAADVIKVLLITMIPFQILMAAGAKWQIPHFTGIAVLCGIVCIWFSARITGRPESFSVAACGNWSFLKSAWYLYLAIIILGAVSLSGIDFKNAPSAANVVFFFIETISGAVFEELLFRGMIQNKIIETCRWKQLSLWRGIMTASAIFALMHILNLIGMPYFILGTFSQVIYTFFLGLLLGTVYFLSENIWIPVIMHIVFNLLGSYSVLFAGEGAQEYSDMPFVSAVLAVILMVPCGIIARRMYKKKYVI